MFNDPLVSFYVSYFFSFIFSFCFFVALNRSTIPTYKLGIVDMLLFSLICYFTVPFILLLISKEEISQVWCFFIAEPLNKLFKPVTNRWKRISTYITGADLIHKNTKKTIHQRTHRQY